MEELSIRQIVERCHQGDREAFGLLYDAMENRLRRVCRRYVADGSTVDDLVHDAFLLIFSKIDTLKDTAKAEAWMLAVTRNLALMYAEHRRNDPTVSFEEVRQPLAASAPSALPITYDEILHLVDVLPEGCQRVFRLSVFEGLSHQQIAALLNIEPHTSSSQLFRAKKLLRQALAVLLVCLLAVFLPIGVWQMMKESGQREDRGDSFRVVAFDTVHIRGFSEPTATEREPRCGSGEDVFDTVQIRRVSVATVTAQSTPRPRPLPLKGRGEAQRALPQLGLGEAQLSTVKPVSLEADTSASLEADASVSSEADSLIMQPTPRPRPLPLEGRGEAQHVLPQLGQGEARISLQLAYSGMGGQRLSDLPYADADTNDPPMDTVTRHRMPMVFGVELSKPISRHFSVGTGLQYTLLRSETRMGNTHAWVDDRQRIGYLGLPLRVSASLSDASHLNDKGKMINDKGEGCRVKGAGHWVVYATASAMVELPLHATVSSSIFVGDHEVEHGDQRLSLPLQWSVGTSLGVEWRPKADASGTAPVVGFFAEPTLQYFFRSGSTPSTWRTDHAVTLSLPIGVRINFK